MRDYIALFSYSNAQLN